MNCTDCQRLTFCRMKIRLSKLCCVKSRWSRNVTRSPHRWPGHRPRAGGGSTNAKGWEHCVALWGRAIIPIYADMINKSIPKAVVVGGMICFAGDVVDATQLYIDPTDLDDFNSFTIEATSTATSLGASFSYVQDTVLGHVIEVPPPVPPGLSELLSKPRKPLK